MPQTENGSHTFLPNIVKDFLDIKALTLLTKKKAGKKVNRKLIHRACRASSWEETPQALIQYPLSTLLDSAHAERRRIKDVSNQELVGRKLRDEWLTW